LALLHAPPEIMHLPPEHVPGEQHSVLAVQLAPALPHATHTPCLQMPEQQSAAKLQLVSSALHAAHFPP
jgi:hypothetical protein